MEDEGTFGYTLGPGGLDYLQKLARQSQLYCPFVFAALGLKRVRAADDRSRIHFEFGIASPCQAPHGPFSPAGQIQEFCGFPQVCRQSGLQVYEVRRLEESLASWGFLQLRD